jgi:5-(carboxyamino)imidazole ribonucleotide synthase
MICHEKGVNTLIAQRKSVELDHFHVPWEKITMKMLSLPYRVGILGGGQLARMLALKAHQMGLEPHVLSLSHQDPAAQVTSWWSQGDPNVPLQAERFLSGVDVATFESEFYCAQSLSQAVEKTQVPLFPQPNVMATLQDRWPQKQLLDRYNISTSPYLSVQNRTELNSAHDTLGLPFVLKKRRFGYDGYGTLIIKDKDQFTELYQVFKEDDVGFIAEAFVPFERELALMMIRSRDKSFVSYPLVESYQQNSRCLWVKGPAQHPNFVPFKEKLQEMLESINYVGAIGIEMFDTGDRLLVNELAPRVHNSGHYTMDAMSEDQFSLHLKSILGLPLGDVHSLAPGFAMYNLLGSGQSDPQWTLPEAVYFHWYGKGENRDGRKMGHLNCLASTPDLALKRLTDARRLIQI